MTYYGFFEHDASITQGIHQGAVDAALNPSWYDFIYAPFETNNPNKVPWKFIRTNCIDTGAGHVKYSAIQRNDGKDNITFSFFHTDECANKVGDVIFSGDFVCKTAPNGLFTGPHCHIAPRRNGMSLQINPYSVLDWYAGGKLNLGVIKGKDNYHPAPSPIPPVDYQQKYNQLQSALTEYTKLKAINEKSEKDALAKLLTL